MLLGGPEPDPRTETEIDRLTEEDRRRLFGPLKPFSVEGWMAAGPPATAEDLAEMEELMREREEERQRSLALEAAGHRDFDLHWPEGDDDESAEAVTFDLGGGVSDE